MAISKIPGAGVSADTLEAGDIAANAIGASELANNAVDTDAIADDAVTNAKIGADAVSTTEIANDASISTSGNIATTGSGTLTVAGKTTLSGDLVPSTPLSNRNMIINGGMNVYQRGSLAITQTNNGGYALDRFSYYQTASVGQWLGTMNQHTMSDAEVVTTGHTTGLKILTTTVENAIGSDEYGTIVYKVEAQDCQRMCAGRTNAKAVTLSFWAKSKVAGDYAISMYQQDGDEIIGSKYTLVADTWTKVEITFAGNTSANINDDSGLGLMFKWILFAGSDWTSSSNTSWSASANAKIGYGHTAVWGTSTSHDFYLTGVQLELGSNATPFEHRSYGDELARCQRYFQTYNPTQQQLVYNEGNPATHKFTMFYIMNPMRAAPSVSLANLSTGSGVGGLSGTVSSVTLSSSPVPNPPCILSCRVNMSTSTGTARYMYHADLWANDPLEYSAEL